jgi:hypothetical protein
VAYRAFSEGKWVVVLDENEGKPYHDNGGIIFSSDGSHFAYTAVLSRKQFVVVDGKEGKPYDEINGLTFTPAGNGVAYSAKVDDKEFVVMDGKEGKPYDGIITMGGGRIVFDSLDRLHYLAGEGDVVYLVEEKIVR